MSEELLNIVKELSEKPTTELALQFMELTADNIVKDKEIDRLNNLNKQLVEECQRLDDEETRLNNIINELEEYCWELKAMGCREGALDMLDKLKELKENNK